jgi:hypothetical protein
VQVTVFFFTRCLLAAVCVVCETMFVRSIDAGLGRRTAVLTAGLLILSPGMFVASSGAPHCGSGVSLRSALCSVPAVVVLHVLHDAGVCGVDAR